MVNSEPKPYLFMMCEYATQPGIRIGHILPGGYGSTWKFRKFLDIRSKKFQQYFWYLIKNSVIEEGNYLVINEARLRLSVFFLPGPYNFFYWLRLSLEYRLPSFQLRFFNTAYVKENNTIWFTTIKNPMTKFIKKKVWSNQRILDKRSIKMHLYSEGDEFI